MEELLKKLCDSFIGRIAVREYNWFRGKDRSHIDYDDFIEIMDSIAKERSVRCRPTKDPSACAMAMVTSQIYDLFDGTGTFRNFTIIGTDGQVIHVKGCDASQKIKIFVQHPDGQIYCEEPDPTETMQRIRGLRFFQ